MLLCNLNSGQLLLNLHARGKTVRGLLLLTFLASLFVHAVPGIDLPTPPPGFTWQEIADLKAAFLRPNGWFFKREEVKGTLAYYITRESIENGGEFQTGLTVNVFRHKKESAVETARYFIDQLAAKKHAEKWFKEVGPFKEFGCLTKDTDSSGTSVSQTLTVANPKTNTMYVFIFESPESDWDSAWKVGKQIMDALAIDENT
jgi:hypothetical protein